MQEKYFNYTSINKKKKRSIGLITVDVLFTIYVLIALCYLVFCAIFIKAQVIGTSMQPTFNINLSYTENAETSQYKDIVFANRFNKGKNGDVIIAEINDLVIIKRLIATEGQTLTLKYESDGFYYFYLTAEQGALPQKLSETYIGNFREYMDYGYFLRFLDVEGVIEDGMISGTSASITIPEGYVFLLGDNRQTSEDSTTYGAVKKEVILGTVQFYHYYNQSFLSFVWQQLCNIF